jgi:Leucine-rich repeat (LRR) protein
MQDTGMSPKNLKRQDISMTEINQFLCLWNLTGHIKN